MDVVNVCEFCGPCGLRNLERMKFIEACGLQFSVLQLHIFYDLFAKTR